MLRVLVTDKLASYGVAHRGLMRSVEHRRQVAHGTGTIRDED